MVTAVTSKILSNDQTKKIMTFSIPNNFHTSVSTLYCSLLYPVNQKHEQEPQHVAALFHPGFYTEPAS